MLNYDITRMKSRVTFGTEDDIPTDTIEGSKEEFVPITTVWCGDYTNTMSQTFTNLGTNTQVDRVIVIRHNPQVKEDILAKLDGIEYKVTSDSEDDRLNAFDLITLRDVSKIGPGDSGSDY